MNRIQRVRAVLEGRLPDRPPVSFWYHFEPREATGRAAVEAHLAHQSKYDLDFVKVMNDAMYPAEGGAAVVRSVRDLKSLRVLDGTEGNFGAQLEVIRALANEWGGRVPFCTTVFNAWTTLRLLVQPPTGRLGPPKIVDIDERDARISAFLREDRAAVSAALEAIGRSLANFARECVRAGADGVFLSVRDDWVDRRENGDNAYDELVRASDGEILSAAAEGTFNIVHVCGRAVNFEAFARYPAHVLNWADRAAGPSIAYARDRVKPALCGGVDNLGTLATGTPEQVATQVRDAVRQAKNRPILIAPGCTYDPDAVPEANLHAMVDAAKAAVYQ